MPQKLTSLLAAAALLLSCSACSSATGPVVEGETQINLSDSTITVDGSPASTDPTSAVYTGAELVYYHDGTDETYGEGLADEMHSQADALAHTVLTITQPGTYRLTGTLSQGQVAVDLGEDAAQDPQAVVTLILDQVDVTCTVAPALIFYRVYECGTAETETAAADVDTSAAGANVVIAAGTENHFTGSHVARIYQEGTTDKLHKYDGAFYSKMSMNIRGDNGDDSGVLNIVSDNEGLDSELHLTVDGGTIHIQAQDDGINTNEDGVSVTTINGGSLTINAGLGTEGDGIDSNGYLVINGGTVWSMANETSPDGGIDADMAILLNGGTVYAFGTRNDAVDASSSQPYMELSFASTLPAGSVISVQDPDGQEIISAITEKTCQSVTVSCPDLSEDIAYAVYVDGVQQQYTGNRSGMMGGPGGGQPPDGMGGGQRPDNMEPPQEGEQVQTTERPEPTQDTPQVQPTDGLEEPPAGGTAGQPDSDRTPPDGMEDRQPPDGFGPSQTGGPGSEETATGVGSTEFTISASIHSFSGISASPDSSGKTAVTFTVNGGQGLSGEALTLTDIAASAEDLPDSDVQITITDVPSEDYAETCLLSDGAEAISALLPTDEGTYQLTIAVAASNESYTGASQWTFVVKAPTA